MIKLIDFHEETFIDGICSLNKFNQCKQCKSNGYKELDVCIKHEWC